jgi:uncharacterized protein (DUF1697 family)
MTKTIAFLRAINVGGHTVKMDRLRRLFEDMGFSGVETFIASGNVIFDANSGSPKALEKKIERRLREALGYEVATFIRSISELAGVARYRPFKNSELTARGHALYIAFLSDRPTATAKSKLMTFATDADDLHVHRREVYWLCRKKMSESAFSSALLEKTLGMPATLRNSTTVGKIVVKYTRGSPE